MAPFGVLLTEILLSRTRAEIVDPVAQSLVARYSSPERLASESTANLERLLRPLGLQRKRAGQLRGCASQLIERHHGRVPRRLHDLLNLPGVGMYAAHAVSCFAHRRRCAVVDANVARIYSRYFGLGQVPARLATAHELWDVAREMLPSRRVRAFNWALLDLGAAVCTPRAPRCKCCPLARGCQLASGTPGEVTAV